MNPWEDYPDIWPTKSAFFTWLRGCLRRSVWEKYPPKLQLKNELCKVPPRGLETRAKTGTYCALSGVWEGKSKLEVDHIKGNASLRGWDDLLSFVQHLCASKDNMQLVTKEAHKIKSYAEKNGISFDEAVIEKQVIAACKSASTQKAFLTQKGITPASNAELRKQQIREILKNDT